MFYRELHHLLARAVSADFAKPAHVDRNWNRIEQQDLPHVLAIILSWSDSYNLARTKLPPSSTPLPKELELSAAYQSEPASLRVEAYNDE